MMEALAEEAGTAEEAAAAMPMEEEVVAALREMLPSMDTATVTIGALVQLLAQRFCVGANEFKAQWKLRLKEIVPDLLEECEEGTQEEEEEAEEEEKVVAPRVNRKRNASKRNVISDESDEGKDSEADAESEEEEKEESVEEDEDEEVNDEEASPPKRRRISVKEEKRSKRAGRKISPSASKKTKGVKVEDSLALQSLKELARAAGLGSPNLYMRLKQKATMEEAEDFLRDHLQEHGVRFNGAYPSSREISTARRKHEKEKELDGIDTSLIISGGRSRRGATQRVSYKEDDGGDPDLRDEAGEPDNEVREEEFEDDGSAAEDGSASESEASEASI